MARLTAAQRKKLPDSAFAGPNRTFPIQDKSHARNALSRASGNASPSLEKKIDAKAHRKYPSIGKGENTPTGRSFKSYNILNAGR